MRSNISPKYMHLVFLLLSFLLVWLKITNGTPIRYLDGEGAGDYKCIDKERDALLHFKSYIHHDPYDSLSTWTSKEGEAANDCCEWDGVKCNDRSRVIGLYLSRANFEGNISPSLLNLSYLTSLELASNSFNGTIPSFISSMTQLETLYLGWNNFTGSIPSELGNLTNLHTLSLSYIGSCTIENLDWLSRLSRLEGLDMAGISLGKVDNWIDVLLTLKRLSFLDLSSCELSQVMHPYSYSFVDSSSLAIGYLHLKDNNLNSSMYHWLISLVSNKTEYLDLSGNKLDGVPKYLGNLCLVYFYFQNNSMPIDFTNFLDNLSGCTTSTLQWLDASGSQFTGSLPDDIQNFSSLSNLYLSGNKLNGTISEKVWELPYLKFLDLSSNSLKGDISNIGKSKYIMTLDLSNNLLEEVSSKGGMTNFICMKIDLSSNKLYGLIPTVASSIKWLDLSNNKFYGNISFLCQIDDASLELLDLSNNSLIGEIPDCLWHLKYLRVLNLGQNNLSGRL
ncbi:hypothetical protein QVD17_01051 [Tagetes erecta]|uniref:Leucine-rich repeat-containing N-terminal plant-type domain-containing protein n=1 Tax=Tagetes erecta TaxID=13708 RepID=A0AAD8L4A8_TARER|nr:hypothetical protein QVD17_01051 [Tagetes erecta]